MTTITEADVEEAALAWLADLGWGVEHGPDIAPDTPNAERDEYDQVVLERRLRDALAELNPSLPVDALDDALRKLTRPEGSTLEARNHEFHRMLVNGVEIEYREDGGRVRGDLVRVIDFDVPANNDLLAVNQFTVTENRNTRRPDVVLFVNGLPLGVMELKNPTDEDATIWSAWQQLQTYKSELPTLFSMNEALVVSDGNEARVGTLTSGREWFKPWRTVTGETLADPHVTELQVMLEGVFEPGASSRSSATSSCSRTTAAARSSRRWRGITSSTRCASRWTRPCGRPSFSVSRLPKWGKVIMKRAGCRAENPVTVGSAWSGTRRVPARA